MEQATAILPNDNQNETARSSIISIETNNSDEHDGGAGNNGQNSSRDNRRQQFTNKQRMDMYAFCVLELEMHSNKVSIKKQHQAIQRVLAENKRNDAQAKNGNSTNSTDQPIDPANHIQPQPQPPPPTIDLPLIPSLTKQTISQAQTQSLQAGPAQTDQPDQQAITEQVEQNGIDHTEQNSADDTYGPSNQTPRKSMGKTLLQLQQELEMTRKSYSDHQKTQVLTSAMLKDIQMRFSKYYPGVPVPSKSTIKHVFDKCVSHGTVENIRAPRRMTKIPQGDEIEHLLIHEPQLSLRQMAQKLNVSTGTVSRRCKALGLIPESVTIKHQQLATARRQKQIKQLESRSKSNSMSPRSISIGSTPSTTSTSNGNQNSTLGSRTTADQGNVKFSSDDLAAL